MIYININKEFNIFGQQFFPVCLEKLKQYITQYAREGD